MMMMRMRMMRMRMMTMMMRCLSWLRFRAKPRHKYIYIYISVDLIDLTLFWLGGSADFKFPMRLKLPAEGTNLDGNELVKDRKKNQHNVLFILFDMDT